MRHLFPFGQSRSIRVIPGNNRTSVASCNSMRESRQSMVSETGPFTQSDSAGVAQASGCARFIMKHDSTMYLVWQQLMLKCTLVTIVMFPLKLAFFDEIWMTALVLAIDGVFVLDMLVSFRLTYVDASTGQTVREGRAMAKHYAKTLLLLDVLSTIPFDLCVLNVEWMALIGFLRFLRVRRILVFFARLEMMESLEFHTTCFFKLLLLLVLNAHTGGCVMWFLASLRNFADDETWVGTTLAHAPFGEQYMVCMYWAFTTLTTVGYGDFSPVSVEERCFGCVYMLFNMGVTAYIIGTASSLSTKGDDERAKYRRLLKDLNQYAKATSLPPELFESMKKYVGMQMSAQHLASTFEENLPSFLSARARNQRNRPILSKVALLAGSNKGVSGKEDSSHSSGVDAPAPSNRFLTALTARMSEAVLINGVRVFEAYDIAQELWVITSGKAEVLVQDKQGVERCVKTYETLDLVGAFSFFSGLPMPWSIKVVGTTTALKLNEADRDALFKAFPEEGRRIMDELAATLEEDKRNCKRALDQHGVKVDDKGLSLRQSHLSHSSFRSPGPLPNKLRALMQSSPLLVHKPEKTRPSQRNPTTKAPPAWRLSAAAAAAAAAGPGADAGAGAGAGAGTCADACGFAGGRRMSKPCAMDLEAVLGMCKFVNKLKRAESGEVEALKNFIALCNTLVDDLRQQNARREQQLSTKLCDLAANNFVPQIKEMLRSLHVTTIPPDYDGRTALHLAAAKGNSEVLTLLTSEGCSLNVCDHFGRTPLYEAVVNHHPECIKALRKLGAHLGLSKHELAVQLCRTAHRGDVRFLEMLLLAGADPAAADADNRTAMHLAACAGNHAVTELLLKYQGSTKQPLASIKDRWGKTPIDDAKDAGNMILLKPLRRSVVNVMDA